MMREEYLPWLFWTGAGFLLGGVMFCDILPRRLAGRDIRQDSDDHNPGAANVFLLCGVPMGLLCLALDLLKGFLPVWLAKSSLDVRSLLFAGVIAAPVLGHGLGVLNHFHGGKCIATSFGVLAALIPESWIVLVLAALYIFFSTVVRVRPMRVRSMLVFALFGLSSVWLLTSAGKDSLALGCLAVSAIAMLRHRERKERPARQRTAEL